MASTDTSASRLPSKDPFVNEQSGYSADCKDDWQRNRSEKELVRTAGKVGSRLPAGLDENRSPAGRFVKGHSVRSGGPKKRLTKREIFERAQQRGGVPLLRRLAAAALGLFDEDALREIPDDLETAEDFQIWVLSRRAVTNLDAFREVWDRLDPKPQKIQLDATVGARRAPIGGSVNADEAAEAEAFYEALNMPTGEIPAGVDEPEEDLAFLE